MGPFRLRPQEFVRSWWIQSRLSRLVDMPYTYVLRCADGSYYVGSTWQEIEARVWQHNNDNRGAAYTRRRRPVTLVWSAWFDSMIEAFAFEKRVQGWSRKKREALIRGDYNALVELSRRKAVQERALAEGDSDA